MYEEHVENSDGLVVSDGTWTYKIPTIDNIPKQFNIKLMKSGHHEKRVLSSKGINVPLLYRHTAFCPNFNDRSICKFCLTGRNCFSIYTKFMIEAERKETQYNKQMK